MIDKSKILEKLTSHHEQLVVELNKTILDLSAEADLTVNETVDMEDSSHQNYSSDMKNHYEGLLSSSLNDLEKLRSFEGVNCSETGPGALIVTDQIMFFIGVATPKLHLKAYQTLIGISTGSEIYKKLRNKKTGDEFEFDNEMLKIKSIL